MKVEKIDITKELMDIPDGKDRMEFVKMPSLSGIVFKEGVTPLSDTITGERMVYSVEQVREIGEPIRRYLVKESERKLFEDLVVINNAKLERRDDTIRQQWYDDIRDTVARIKHLPWWERLFNNF